MWRAKPASAMHFYGYGLSTMRDVTPDQALASMLFEARQASTPLQTVPETLVPMNATASYAVQDVVADALRQSGAGEIVGWKVGAATPTATPTCAPLHRTTVFESGHNLSPSFCRYHGVEAEIAYSFSRDLPARQTPWTQSEVEDSIGAIHGAIELLDTRFTEPNTQHDLSHLADQGSHGILVVGRGMTEWRNFSPVTLPLSLLIDGCEEIKKVGGNHAGDPMRLLTWLANHAATRGMPLRAGTIVTTGSTMGTLFVEKEARICVTFEGLFPVELRMGRPLQF